MHWLPQSPDALLSGWVRGWVHVPGAGATEPPEVAFAAHSRGPRPEPQALCQWPGILGIFPGCTAEVAQAPEKGPQVIPKNREPRNERTSAQNSGSEGPREGAGPQVTEAPPQAVLTSGPGDTLRCPSKTFSSNLGRRKFRGWGTQNRYGKS